jgi:enamine deaminase RidA (YjgF/YER057c/UK114 family)
MIIERIAELGYEFKPAPEILPGFPIRSAVRAGNLVFTSGQGPTYGGETIVGAVGDEVDLATAQTAAERCALNCLRAAATVVDLDKVVKVVKVLGFVNTSPGFIDTSGVINGCSYFLEKVFGDSGIAARTAVGGLVLPINISVEVEMVLEVEA